jgi:hypothetical protein
MLQHRWFMSERAGRDVGRSNATANYVQTVLVTKPDERAILAAHPAQDAVTEELRLVFPDSTPGYSG